MANDTTKNHPVGEGVGAAGGAVAGMATGAAVGGPMGAVVGAAVGAVAGGVAGHGVAAAIDPTVEDVYWQQHYASRPYVRDGAPYTDYREAYRFGWESAGAGYSSFEAAEPDLATKWRDTRGASRLDWDDARHAVRDSWHRVERAIPGDADGDGR
jgi:hypothetical protein